MNIIYKPLEVEVIEIGGLVAAIKSMRLPKRSENDSDIYPSVISESGESLYTTDSHIRVGPKDKKLAGNLIRAGNDHGKFQRGIIVWLELKMQTGFMIEFETYRHGVECLSTSSAMHGELKELTGIELAEQKQKDLPEKVYTRIAHFSYQALRSMYRARRKHRHPDWQIFCDFIETLPFFDVFIMPDRSSDSNR